MNYFLKKFLSTFLVFYLPKIVIAQPDNIEFEHITINEGLSQNTVFAITQDRYGFLWFGTEDGLNKYNGYNFTVYNIDLENPLCISDNTITSILEDHEGVIWVGTNNGLNRYDPLRDGFIKYFNNYRNDSSICSNRINSIIEDINYNLWIATEKGLSKYIREHDVFDNYFNIPGNLNSLSSNYINCLMSDKKGNLWIGTNKGLDMCNQLTERFIHYNQQTGSLNSNVVFSLLEDHAGNIWIGTDIGELNEYVVKENKFYSYEFNAGPSGGLPNNAYALHEDKYNLIWVATHGGLYSFNGISFKHYKPDLNNTKSINNERLLSIYEDKSGVFWIGTRGGGLNKFYNTRQKFKHYKKEAEANSLPHNNIYSFADDGDNKIWIATLNGLSYLNLETGQFTNYFNEPGNEKSLSNNQVWYVYKDNSGTIWAGTEDGLNRFDRATNSFIRYYSNPLDSTSLSSSSVYSIIEDHENNFWVGTINGLNKFDRKTKKCNRYFNSPNDSTSISSDLIWNFLVDRFDTLWIATYKGLNKYNRKTNNFKQYLHDPNDLWSISNNYIDCLVEDEKGNIWVGTSYGVNKYLREKDKFIYYTKKDGLADNVIYAILVDGNDNLWMSSNAGIILFNETRKVFKNYTVYDGLQGNEFNFAHCKLSDGRMLFGGLNGFNVFHPDSIIENRVIPQVVITEFKLFDSPIHTGEEIGGRVILKNKLEETKRIQLKYNENLFTIEFAALHYVSPERNQYAYKMDGINNDWVHIGNRRFVPYTKIPPGDYTFHVIASNNDGVWNKEGTSLEITILPPFWQTIWFRVIAISIFFLSLYLLYLRRISVIKQQKIILEQEVKERTHLILEINEELVQQKEEIEIHRDALAEANNTKDKFFSIISHDLKSPFNAILGLSEILAEDYQHLSKEKGEMFSKQLYHSAKQVYNLVDNLLEWSKTKTNRIKSIPEKLDLKKIADEVISVVILVAREKNIEIENNIQKNTFVHADPYLVPVIIRNLLSNAIKFSKLGGRVTLNERKSGDYVEISVVDSGVGMKDEDVSKLFREDIHFTTAGTNKEKGTGLGLILCKEFVEKMGGKIWVESKEGKGSAFTFTLPKVKD